MKEIKGLIKKDLLNLASYKSTLIIVVICVCIAGSTSQVAINYIPIMMTAMIGMIALSTFSYDEIAKTDKYVLTLPINKKEVVIEKYILVIGCIFIGAIIGFIVTPIIINIMNYFRPENNMNIDYNLLLTTTIGGIFGISLVSSIQIPSIYKWGAERGRIQMFILVFGLIAIIVGIGYLLVKANINIDYNILNNFLDKFGLIALIIISFIMLYVSYKIAYKIYLKEER